MSERTTKGISRKGLVKISKNLVEEHKRICKAGELRVTRRSEETECVSLVAATEKWIVAKWILETWILEGGSRRTLPVIVLSITLLGSRRRPYSVLVICLKDGWNKVEDDTIDGYLAVLWVIQNFVSVVDLRYLMSCREGMPVSAKRLPCETSPLRQFYLLQKRLEAIGQDVFLRLSSCKPCELGSGL